VRGGGTGAVIVDELQLQGPLLHRHLLLVGVTIEGVVVGAEGDE